MHNSHFFAEGHNLRLFYPIKKFNQPVENSKIDKNLLGFVIRTASWKK